jgi:hypothetical protein
LWGSPNRASQWGRAELFVQFTVGKEPPLVVAP